jgi:hypothetical protein
MKMRFKRLYLEFLIIVKGSVKRLLDKMVIHNLRHHKKSTQLKNGQEFLRKKLKELSKTYSMNNDFNFFILFLNHFKFMD